jgi:aerobic-type carbon monoxide dehydrogenase small subunit (CoxS/CutS family)
MTVMRVRGWVNGTEFDQEVEPRTLLADLLRRDLHLHGTHVGCEHGVCGACTVIVDGAAIRSCLMLAVQADGARITTIEGVALKDGTLHPLQQALRDEHAVQCGFCTPGFVLSVLSYVETVGPPERGEIREVLSGNICRCTGYQNIVHAIERYLDGDGSEAA